jgi:hypothetical protein
LYKSLDLGPNIPECHCRLMELSYLPTLEHPHLQSTGHGIPAFERAEDRPAFLAQRGQRPAVVLRGWIKLARHIGLGLSSCYEWGMRSEYSQRP